MSLARFRNGGDSRPAAGGFPPVAVYGLRIKISRYAQVHPIRILLETMSLGC